MRLPAAVIPARSAARIAPAFGLLALLPLLTAAQASAQQPSQRAETILISGSSTVYPFSLAAIEQFRSQTPKGVRFEAKAVGSSAGFRDFCAGRLSIAAASRPINSAELSRCKANGVRFLELPIAFDAITVVVNPRNSFARTISTAQLRNLWNREAQGKVMRWNQVNPAWPATPIKLCGPGRDSGTYDTFNKAINGSTTNSRQDYTASEDDTVLVRCVASNPGALGYFGYDYYQANRNQLRALAVQGTRGTVLPSVQSVQDSRYLPLSRPLFFYVNDQALKTRPVVRAMVSSTLQRGVKIAQQAGVIPLQDSTYRLVTNKLYRNVLGSAFAGKLPIGLTVGQVLERSFDEHKKPQFR
jgi:phosphate transport system substrate-binding protein